MRYKFQKQKNHRNISSFTNFESNLKVQLTFHPFFMTVFCFFFSPAEMDRYSIGPLPHLYSVNVVSATVRKGLISNQKEQLDGKVTCISGQDLVGAGGD